MEEDTRVKGKGQSGCTKTGKTIKLTKKAYFSGTLLGNHRSRFGSFEQPGSMLVSQKTIRPLRLFAGQGLRKHVIQPRIKLNSALLGHSVKDVLRYGSSVTIVQ